MRLVLRYRARCRRTRSLTDEVRIRNALYADRRVRAMPRNDRRCIRKIHQLSMNRRYDIFHRRAAEIPTSDSACEKRVAREQMRRCRAVSNSKADASRRMTRSVQHFDAHRSDRETVAVGEIAV